MRHERELAVIAEAADVDRRSLDRYLRGEPTRPAIARRCRRALVGMIEQGNLPGVIEPAAREALTRGGAS
jgi:hypothetical protein